MKETMNFRWRDVFRKRKDMYVVNIERIDGKVFRSQDVMEVWDVEKASAKCNVNCIKVGLKRHKEEALLLYEKAKQNFNLSEYKVTMELLKEDGYHAARDMYKRHKKEINESKKKDEAAKEAFNVRCDAYRKMRAGAKDEKDLKDRINAFRSGKVDW